METRFTVRKIVIAGVLSAIAILLGATRIGFIPVPTAAGHATIMHVPAILGGIMEGWVVGCVIGTIFGLFSFFQATVPLFKDPLVAILPRIFIGITAALSYKALKGVNDYLAMVVAAVVGTLTNTVLVLGMATLRGYLAPAVSVGIGITHGIPEIIVAAIITVAVVTAWKRLESGGGKSSV
ncbi:MAG: ECF transporter S component [Chloroflexi bacterium]|nr:MAG: ECF transporter S component [Chloroflexota bacterium]HDN78885.1 ECF transporter S component [Chloroflexota bacterium]